LYSPQTFVEVFSRRVCLLGHSSLTMTDRYVYAVSDGPESIKKLDKAGKSATIRNIENVRAEKVL